MKILKMIKVLIELRSIFQILSTKERFEKQNIFTVSRNAPASERQPRDGLPALMMVDQKGKKMIFMKKLQKQKEEAKAAYIKARNEWEETITAENIKGDFEKWKNLCDRKADCRRLGVLI